ncbi:peptidase E [Alisedimentitalea sp. MJ-SS2]|uniref:Type 1 glutamine amidotransferase-like domain-containing protein n=1 Tax=Aliisedimentitalea sp. MJ-SS2 TaxID=3049795 RepID=UPI00290B31E9|nr:peptidase E [Alisedimentitalea sp. MJ-SS2]MDU8925927.1 peptidase E [Alisedimentitalea sp. MJ-SS2]
MHAETGYVGRNDMKIIAIGGGGFTHDAHPELDDFCLSATARGNPRLAFIGAASGDDPQKTARFNARFADVAETLVHLPMTLPAAQLARSLEQVDLVYVGGGDTEKMVAAWRREGWDKVLSEACRSGVILAGVSAGAVCWFDSFLFSSGKGAMRPLPGLGLIPIGACPHYSSETDRRAALHAAVGAQTMPASIAIDDGVAVAFENGLPTGICGAQAGAGAYVVRRGPQGVTEEYLSIG